MGGQTLRMRDHDEPHRAATALELLFDLCFVVAVAAAGAQLHHAIADDHAVSGVVRYALLFIPLWWAWMSFTWFATAFDNDTVSYRLLTLAQMAGVLAVAACIPAAFDGSLVAFALAYTLMRLPLILQWWRAGRADQAYSAFASRYARGSAAAQALWLLSVAVPGPASRLAVWALALAVDLGTPPWAVRAAPGRVFHAGHIAERYGLFTLIVLGESIFAVSAGLQSAIADGTLDAEALAVSGLALIVAFSLWWLYFDTIGRGGLERNRRAAFAWGYGHYLVFAGIAAVGAGFMVQLDVLTGAHHEIGNGTAGAAVAVPAAVTLLAFALLQLAANRQTRAAALLIAVAATAGLLALASGAVPILVTDVVLASALAAGARTATSAVAGSASDLEHVDRPDPIEDSPAGHR